MPTTKGEGCAPSCGLVGPAKLGMLVSLILNYFLQEDYGNESNDTNSTASTSSREWPAKQQSRPPVYVDPGGDRAERDQAEWPLHHSRHRAAGQVEAQGSHGKEPSQRCVHQDCSQDGGEVPGCQGRPGLHRSEQGQKEVISWFGPEALTMTGTVLLLNEDLSIPECRTGFS